MPVSGNLRRAGETAAAENSLGIALTTVNTSTPTADRNYTTGTYRTGLIVEHSNLFDSTPPMCGRACWFFMRRHVCIATKRCPARCSDNRFRVTVTACVPATTCG
jgi:hypothetical protein